MTTLKLINGGKREDEVLACHKCNGTTLIAVVVGAMSVEHVEDGLHIRGGVDQMICAQCLAEGTVEPVVS
jgi:hypothetical protein